MKPSISINVRGYAASELDAQSEEAAPGDELYPLLSRWSGTHVHVHSAAQADELATIACSWANGIDADIMGGRFRSDPEGRRVYRAIAAGLWRLSERLRSAAEQARGLPIGSRSRTP